MVFFEAPHRLDATLVALANGLGSGRRAAVCRELTKTYEEVRRGTLGELSAWARGGVLGECTVVVAGASPQDRRAEILALTDQGRVVFADLGQRAIAYDQALRAQIGPEIAAQLDDLLRRIIAEGEPGPLED